MASPQANASARKIANYTQSISSGVTNLLTELGRVNIASSVDADSNNAILSKLETLTILIQDMSNRLSTVERTVSRLDSDGTVLLEIAPQYSNDDDGVVSAECVLGPLLCARLTCAREHNSRARRHNNTVERGDGALMPLRTPHNTLVVGFPSTLGHLVSLGSSIPQIYFYSY